MGKKTKSVNNKQSTGIDFIRAKKKVGRKIRKQANETNTEVKAKRINLSVQSVGAVGKGGQVTGRGLSMPELLNQCQHYSARVRKDALDGIQELLQNHPSSLIPCAATCVEKVAERLVDQEQIVRAAARGASFDAHERGSESLPQAAARSGASAPSISRARAPRSCCWT